MASRRSSACPLSLRVAGDVLEAGLAQAKATLSARAADGTQAIADLLQKQAELGTQLSEKLKARAQEFSALAAEVQESVGTFTADAANRATPRTVRRVRRKLPERSS